MKVNFTGTLLIAALLMLAGCGSGPKVTEPADTGPQPVDTSANTDMGGDVVDRNIVDPFKNAIEVSSGPTYAELLATTILFFDFDEARIRPENQAVIAAHARYLSENPNLRLRLEGHADERGSREYNIGLGERRAQAVRRAMAVQGAGSGQLSTRSFGEEKPLDPGHGEGSWAANRRVELMYH